MRIKTQGCALRRKACPRATENIVQVAQPGDMLVLVSWFTVKKLECLEFITCKIVAGSVASRPKKIAPLAKRSTCMYMSIKKFLKMLLNRAAAACWCSKVVPGESTCNIILDYKGPYTRGVLPPEHAPGSFCTCQYTRGSVLKFAQFAPGACSQIFNRLNIVEHFAGWNFFSRRWSIPVKSLVYTEELCSRSVPLEHARGAKSLLCIGLKRDKLHSFRF